MTALKKYARLEASGLWTESSETKPVDVLITFGKTSIILSDYKDNPLTHWSLAAIKLVSRNDTEAIFSADFDNSERLRVDDVEMIEALILFINSDEKQPQRVNIPFYLILSAVVIVSTLMVVYFPSKIKNLAISIISEHHEKQLITPFLKEYLTEPNSICNSAKTDGILNQILNEIEPKKNSLSILIIKDRNKNILHLPGGIIVVSNAFLSALSDESKFITLLKNELSRAQNKLPLKTLINQQTTFDLIKFLLEFQSKLKFHDINDFTRPSPENAQARDSKLDDFSWVTLQNACLN